MPRYLLAFHGGNPPQDPEKRAGFMARWRGWAGGLGDAVADEGAVLSRSVLVTDADQAIAEPGEDRLTGFTLIDADSLQEATHLVRGCPDLRDRRSHRSGRTDGGHDDHRLG